MYSGATLANVSVLRLASGVSGSSGKLPSFHCFCEPLIGGIWGAHVHRYSVRGYIPGGDNLTGALVLVAITAAFGTIAFLMLLAGFRSSAAGLCAIFTTVRPISYPMSIHHKPS